MALSGMDVDAPDSRSAPYRACPSGMDVDAPDSKSALYRACRMDVDGDKAFSRARRRRHLSLVGDVGHIAKNAVGAMRHACAPPRTAHSAMQISTSIYEISTGCLNNIYKMSKPYLQDIYETFTRDL